MLADRAARRRQDDARHRPRPQGRRGRLPRLLHHRRRPRRPHQPRRARGPLGDHDALLERPAAADHRRARLPADARRSRRHLFQVVSRRYEHGSIVLTTNRGIADWGEIFDDTTVAAAILDRLLHHATVLTINGDSYRMRGHRARAQTPPSRPPSAENRRLTGSRRPLAGPQNTSQRADRSATARKRPRPERSLAAALRALPCQASAPRPARGGEFP